MHRRTLITTVAIALGALTMGVTAGAAGAQGEATGDPKFCSAVTDTSLLFNQIDDEPTKKQQKQLGKLATRLEQSAPAELSAQVTTAIEVVRGGDFEAPGVAEAIDAIDTYVATSCGYPVHDVTGADYSFGGVPESVDKGVNLFKFTNEGAELHEMVIQRIKGDETVEELLELPEKQAEKKLEFIGATFAEQGATTYLYADLKKPGRYAVVCFLPVGSTSGEAIETAEGPPHAAEGMVTEFEVEKSS